MNPISTGYKPEWGLGAVYQGINAADSEALNQEELIKSFLANQRETQMQPLDVQVRGLEAAQAGVQNTPDMLKRFAQSKQAGYDKAQRENELGALMQPFLKEKAPLEGKAQVDQALQNSNLLELQKTIDSGVDRNGQPISPQDMQVLNQEYQKQIALRGQTPELFGKLAVEDKKGQWDLEKQRLANKAALRAAQIRASGMGGLDKLKQTWIKLAPKVRMGQIQGALATNINPLTNEQLTDTERMFFEQQYIQDKNIVNAEINARGAGNVTIQNGKLVPVDPIDVTSSKRSQITSGTTKSGNTFKVERTGD